ncbi:ParB-like partition protein, partial [Lachnospiraceae bacterium JC7]
MSIIENIQRDDLNPVEEALAYQSLIDDYGLTQEEVASRVSKNRTTITNSLRLLKLDDELLEMLREGLITQGHARALLAIEDSELIGLLENEDTIILGYPTQFSNAP